MKKNILNFVCALAVVFSATANSVEKDKKKEVNVESSTVTWKAYKVRGGHEGTVGLKSGFLTFDKKKLSGGEFVVDMTTINTTDVQGGMKDKLDGHLKNDDFFSVDSHPTATLVFTNVETSGDNTYKVTADLTIKGISKPVTFDLTISDANATASLSINRTLYDVKYGSTLIGTAVDRAIKDEFDLIVDLAL